MVEIQKHTRGRGEGRGHLYELADILNDTCMGTTKQFRPSGKEDWLLGHEVWGNRRHSSSAHVPDSMRMRSLSSFDSLFKAPADQDGG